MELGRLREKIAIYSVVREGQDSGGNNVQFVSFVIDARVAILKSTEKDYVNKSFNSNSTSNEKSLIMLYQLKNYIETTHLVLYKDEWYEILDKEPDEVEYDSLKIRIKETNKGVTVIE